MIEGFDGDKPDEPITWSEEDSQAFIEYCHRSDFLDWIKLMYDKATEAQASLKQPDGSDMLTNRFIIKSAGEETGFSFSHQRLKAVPKNRHTMTPFSRAIIRLPDGVTESASINRAFLSIFEKSGQQLDYYVDEQELLPLKKLDTGNYEVAGDAAEADYENLRIILGNFEIGLQNNSSDNAA